ncbi:putative kinesin K39, partial [Leptomonas seymouri]
MCVTRRQADEMQTQNLRLREEQALKERELQEEIAKREAAFSVVRRRKDAEIASGREKLEQTMAQLEKEQRDRESVLEALRIHQQKLQTALASSERTAAERDHLQQQLRQLQEERTRLSQALSEKEKLNHDLQRIQEECDETERERDSALCQLEEMEGRYHQSVFHLLTLLDMAIAWEDELHDRALSERDSLAVADLDAVTAAAERTSAECTQICESLNSRLQTAQARAAQL